jgi:anti-sigma B factor antagonist
MYTPGEFEVEFHAGRLAVVRLLGEHDISTTQALAERLSQLIESGSPLIFDLSDADFLDSAVVHVIQTAQEDARAVGVPLVVVAPTHASLVRRLLELTGLGQRIPVFPTRAAAEREIAG